ncbi:ribonuclease II [Beutenbergia cavernae DSM 12333]|uniref:Ribonuclease II n=1 Tax=Beutenbergia cavernae (strain ATCC BAA-8 / DSM 12333 / CCUG 43141 / JCM 11478 / NBRC 16432 / NCIMB 13614 / HKI 0122) TaxID=471853 RepID=C5C2S1_BEUC1|nr:RNB domain-containing ribonuclease [Beutenbergia cavernae]ACQ81765.1 ribonuclease II [Beutenbergia cavernae DSM 12333]
MAAAARRYLRAEAAAAARIHPELERLRSELEIPTSYDPAALAEADAARPEQGDRLDARDLELVTIDPPESMDLDQALHLARDGAGYVVHYAIADVAAFVPAGGALDAETHRRGVTYYGPDGRFGLHPPELSEGAASLLPDVDRPAVLWRIALDAEGEIADVDARRALVRSRAKLSYAGVQADLDAGRAGAMLELLPVIGALRAERELDRGGVSLEIPEQEIEVDDGGYRLVYRRTLPVEQHNAQISLLTGIAAARLMREARIGVFRTLDAARESDIRRLRRAARGLGLDWSDDQTYAAFVRTLDSSVPAHAAFAQEATTLFRGAGYAAFDGEVPHGAAHGAIAAEYAHVTAPLRRLVDRYGLEIALATSGGTPVPAWVREALDALPKTMARTGQKAGAYERGCLDVVEAVLLASRVGEVFDGVVVDVAKPRGGDGAAADGTVRGAVVIADPAVDARVEAPAGTELVLGERVRVRLVDVDVAARRVLFEPA